MELAYVSPGFEDDITGFRSGGGKGRNAASGSRLGLVSKESRQGFLVALNFEYFTPALRDAGRRLPRSFNAAIETAPKSRQPKGNSETRIEDCERQWVSQP